MNIQLDEKEIATILAALRLFQTEAIKTDIAQAFPDHFAEISPLSSKEIDYLCGCINENICVYHNSPEFRWQQLMEGTVIEDNTPLNRLILQLAYAVEDEFLTADNAFDVLNGNRSPISEIERDDHQAAALAAFDEREKIRNRQNIPQLNKDFSVEAYISISYLTREFIRKVFGFNDVTKLSNDECDLIIFQMQELAQSSNLSEDALYQAAYHTCEMATNKS